MNPRKHLDLNYNQAQKSFTPANPQNMPYIIQNNNRLQFQQHYRLINPSPVQTNQATPQNIYIQQQGVPQQINVAETYMRQHGNIPRPTNNVNQVYTNNTLTSFESSRRITPIETSSHPVSSQSNVTAPSQNAPYPQHIVAILSHAVNQTASQGQGKHKMLTSCVRSLLENKMDINAFLSLVQSSKNYEFTAEQTRLLREYFDSKSDVHTSDVSQNIHNNSSQNMTQSNKSSTNVVQQPTQAQNTKIPQLTVMQNNQSNSAFSYAGRTQNQFQIRPQQAYSLASLFPDSGLQEFVKTGPEPEVVDKDAGNEEEIDFDIGGVNLKEEENILTKISYNQPELLSQYQSIFNHEKLLSIISSKCKSKGVLVNEEDMQRIAYFISYALEIKLRQILHSATVQVHHRLNNFTLKSKQYLINNPEQSFGFIEDVVQTRETKKGIEKSKTKGKEQEKKPNKTDDNQRSSYSNAMFLASVKGSRRIENFQNMILDEQKNPNISSNIPFHQRMRYSAVKQRKISIQDIFQIFESDPRLKKSMYDICLLLNI